MFQLCQFSIKVLKQWDYSFHLQKSILKEDWGLLEVNFSAAVFDQESTNVW